MDIKIIFCNAWSYRPFASRAEAEISMNFADAEIYGEYGDRGDFRVELNGETIFDKNAFPRPRFPDDGELTQLIKEKLNQ